MYSCSTQEPQRKIRGKRTKDDGVLQIKYPSVDSQFEEESVSRSSVEDTPKLTQRKSDPNRPKDNFSFDDFLTLLEEHKSFKEDLETLQKSNFNLDNILSNCTLKVEDLNRKILLVEYGLSDVTDPVKKWENKRDQQTNGLKDKNTTPLKDTYKTSDTDKMELSLIDGGRRKVEKNARIHGIVDVEIELYSNDDTGDDSDDGDNKTDAKHGYDNIKYSSNTFNCYDESESHNGDTILSQENKLSDVRYKRYTSDSGYVENMIMETDSVDSYKMHHEDRNLNTDQIEDNSNDPDDDKFSETFSTTEAINENEVKIGSDDQSLMKKTLGTLGISTLVDTPGQLVDAGVGDYNFVECQDVGTNAQIMDDLVTGVSRSPKSSVNLTAIMGLSQDNDFPDLVLENDDENDVTKKEREKLENENEEEESTRQKIEADEVSRLLDDLEITEDDIEKQHNKTRQIDTKVEDRTPLQSKDISSEDRTSHTQDDITYDSLDDASNMGFEDAGGRKRKKSGRPFPKRAARSLFARLCACWHH